MAGSGEARKLSDNRREQRGGFWLETLWTDVRYGLRTLRKNPGFAAVAILTLALGIGANTAMFSAVNTVLLRPLLFTHPERLVQVWQTEPAVPQAPFAAPDFVDLRAQNQTFEDMTIFTWPQSLNLSGAGEPEHISGILAQANFFSVLGSAPMLGRTFVNGEDQAGHNHVAVLSHGLWQRRFGGTKDALGKEVELGGEKYQIVGVMPPDFRMGLRADLWVPIDMDPKKLQARGNHSYPVIGRLKPGVTVQQANANLNAIAKRLEAQYPDSDRQIGADVVEMREQLTGRVRPALLVLLGAVALVLLIACVNVANLLLARASSRQREIALRSALGAGRSRIIRQLLTESVLLSFLAAIPGLLLAYWGVSVLATLPGVPVKQFGEIHVDVTVLCFALGIAALTGLVFGLVPALQVGRRDLHDDLKSGGKGVGSAASSSKWVRNGLVVGEIALSLCLLIGAGLLLRTFERLRSVEIGVRPDNVLTAKVALPESQYSKDQQVRVYREMAERLERAPGVDAAAVSSEMPLDGGTNSYAKKPGAPAEELGALMEFNEVTPGYFKAFGIPFRAGRNFTEADYEVLDKVDAAQKASPTKYVGPNMLVIINQKMATDFWPNEDAVGKIFESDSIPMQVIGVVADTKIFNSPRQKTIDEAYFPLGSATRTEMSVTLHGSQGAGALPETLRQTIAGIDSRLPVFDVRPMRQVIVESSSDTQFEATLLAIFAGLALLLAAVGIYGVMSYLVAQRTQELGIRMALGAQPLDLLRLVIGRGVALTVAGLAIGLVAAFAVTRLLSTLLFGVSATDPVTFFGVAILLGVVALAACYIPARRATRIDPLIALRYE
ncbi:MAG: ABC transporter permease [Candidatus Acidiferrales bacterium]